MRYRLRTLLIVLAIGPPVLAWWGWPIARQWFAAPTPPSSVIGGFLPRSSSGRSEPSFKELVAEAARQKAAGLKPYPVSEIPPYPPPQTEPLAPQKQELLPYEETVRRSAILTDQDP
jgi:hypothetical protein